MKIFISIPMNGLSRQQIKEEMDLIIRSLPFPGEDIELIDTWIDEEPPTDWNGNYALWYLIKSIELLAQADIVVMANGWEEARGCKVEYECAKGYGIPVLENVQYLPF